MERPTKRHSRSRSPSPKAFGNKILEKRTEPIKRIFDRKKMNFTFGQVLILNLF